MEVTFFSLDKEFVLQQSLEYLTDMVLVGLEVWGEDENIIQIHKQDTSQHIPEYVIYESLKDSRGVSETEWHYQVLKVTEGCVESCFPLIPLPNANKVVCAPQVQLGINLLPMERGKSRVNQWQRISVLDSNLVQSSEIYTGSK